MIIMRMDTEHHEFVALGETPGKARHALESALQFHGEACGLENHWWSGHYDVRVTVINPGECFRDGQLLYRESNK